MRAGFHYKAYPKDLLGVVALMFAKMKLLFLALLPLILQFRRVGLSSSIFLAPQDTLGGYLAGSAAKERTHPALQTVGRSTHPDPHPLPDCGLARPRNAKREHHCTRLT